MDSEETQWVKDGKVYTPRRPVRALYEHIRYFLVGVVALDSVASGRDMIVNQIIFWFLKKEWLTGRWPKAITTQSPMSQRSRSSCYNNRKTRVE